jgi:hypothetical protein
MKKCDWCPHSHLDKKGQLCCPYSICMLTRAELTNLIEKITKIKEK